MDNRILRVLPLFLLIVVADFLILRYLNFKFPVVGHDFYYVLPRMVDAKIYFLVNGLDVQWYTPSFGGGTPAFPNPVFTQFSIPTLLSTMFEMWSAVELTIVLCASLAVLMTYLLLRRNFALSSTASLVGAAGFAFNGFMFSHLPAGHLPYHIFYFLPCLAYVISTPVANPLRIILVTGFVYGLSVYSAGVETLISMGISLVVAVLFFQKMRLDRMRFLSYMTGAFLGGAIAAAKLNAVSHFMSRFPREAEAYSSHNLGAGLLGIGAQILGFPFFRLLGMESKEILSLFSDLNNNPWGMWEHDVYITFPILVVLLFALIWFLVTKPGRQEVRSWWQGRSRLIFLGLLMIWFTVELITSSGVIFDLIKNMPVLKSFHVNIRFTSVFVLPLCLAGASAYGYFEDRFLKSTKWRAVVASVFLLLCGLNTLAYEYRIPEDRILQTFDARRILETSRQVSAGHLFPVKNLGMIPDDVVFLLNTSDLLPYEPIFGRNMEALQTELRKGPVTEIRDGKFNMTHPASFVFPEENGLAPFERIHIEDRDNMEHFINRRATSWKISSRQKVANAVTLLALFGLLAGILFELRRGWKRLVGHEN